MPCENPYKTAEVFDPLIKPNGIHSGVLVYLSLSAKFWGSNGTTSTQYRGTATLISLNVWLGCFRWKTSFLKPGCFVEHRVGTDLGEYFCKISRLLLIHFERDEWGSLIVLYIIVIYKITSPNLLLKFERHGSMDMYHYPLGWFDSSSARLKRKYGVWNRRLSVYLWCIPIPVEYVHQVSLLPSLKLTWHLKINMLFIHPGRLTAGTYFHHPWKERKMIWTKPLPWLCSSR